MYAVTCTCTCTVYHYSADQIYHVCVMMCYDKKLEASRNDFYSDLYRTRDVDCVITSGTCIHCTCSVLLCFVVCLTLLASFFLPSSSLIKIYIVHLIYILSLCVIVYRRSGDNVCREIYRLPLPSSPTPRYSVSHTYTAMNGLHYMYMYMYMYTICIRFHSIICSSLPLIIYMIQV